MKNLTPLLAEYIESTSYDDLPPEVVRTSLFLLVDTIAVGLAGSQAPGIQEMRAVALAEGGLGQASIWGYGDWVPAREAAAINGAMAHAWDYDANHDRIGYKACVTVVPAAVAMAQWIHRGRGKVQGKDFLAAVYLGFEVGTRLGLGINPKPGHALARAVGCFGSAVGAAKILGLPADKIRNALGIAYAETGIGTQTTEAPALTKRLGAGIASRAGVWAALLAERGFTGPPEVFSGGRGFYQKYFGVPEDRDLILGGLGERHEMMDVSVKPYPSCRYTHSPIDCTLLIREKEKIDPERIEKVVVSVDPRAFAAVGGGGNEARLQALRNPQGIVDAQFSIPYTVAVALVKGSVKLEDFSGKGLRQERVLEMARKIEVARGSKSEEDSGEPFLKRVSVEVRTKEGRIYETSAEAPGAILSEERLREKAYDCLGYGGLKPDRFQIFVDEWFHLDDAADVNEIFKSLTTE